MKRIGLIVLCIVLAFGAMGVGYSMWSQGVTVSGSVNTGSLEIYAHDAQGTWGWKDVDAGSLIMMRGYGTHDSPMPVSDPDDLSAGADLALIGRADCNISADHLVITCWWDNLFPINGMWTIMFDVTNGGTIPFKIDVTQVGAPFDYPNKYGDDPDDGDIWVSPHAFPLLESEDFHITLGYYSPDGSFHHGFGDNVEGLQIEPGQTVTLGMQIWADESLPQSWFTNPTTGLHTSGIFKLALGAQQWNEFEADPEGTPS